MAVSRTGPAGVQLPLPVHLRDDATLENFLAPPALAPLLPVLRAQCAALPGEAAEPLVFLHGAAGVGKSHLLQAGCHLAGERALYLPLAELSGYAPADVLADVEQQQFVALDDLQSVLGNRDWEVALFDLCNRARESGCRLLVAADAAPRTLHCALDDLRSRLSWGVTFQLPQLNDSEKQAVLCFRAERRGLLLPEEAAAYIVSRAPRGLSSLLELLDLLDRQSLAHKRALSIPFIRQALDW